MPGRLGVLRSKIREKNYSGKTKFHDYYLELSVQPCRPTLVLVGALLVASKSMLDCTGAKSLHDLAEQFPTKVSKIDRDSDVKVAPNLRTSAHGNGHYYYLFCFCAPGKERTLGPCCHDHDGERRASPCPDRFVIIII